MNKEIVKCSDKKTGKCKFYCYKKFNILRGCRY